MKILDAGHYYSIDNIDDDKIQTIKFVKREGEGFPFNAGNFPGTNCQEVLRVLINRTEYLNSQIPSAETEGAISAMKTALFLFEVRAARRHGNFLDLRDLHEPVRLNPCKTCGHICCNKHK